MVAVAADPGFVVVTQVFAVAATVSTAVSLAEVEQQRRNLRCRYEDVAACSVNNCSSFATTARALK